MLNKMEKLTSRRSLKKSDKLCTATYSVVSLCNSPRLEAVRPPVRSSTWIQITLLAFSPRGTDGDEGWEEGALCTKEQSNYPPLPPQAGPPVKSPNNRQLHLPCHITAFGAQRLHA